MSGHLTITPQLVLDTLLQSHVPVAVFAWRNEAGWPLEFVSPNVELVLGYTAEDFISGQLQYAQIIHEDDLGRVFEEVQHYSATDAVAFEHDDYRIVDPDGRSRWVKDHTTIFRDEQGQITHYFGYILDITANIEALEQVRAAQQDANERSLRLEQEQLARKEANAANVAKSQFMATMSHELRTPLNAIIGYASLITELVEDDAIHTDALLSDIQRIKNAGRHLLTLVDDILDLSKVETGHTQLHITRFSLEDLCDEAILQIQPAAKKNRNTLEPPSDLAGVELETDRVKLQQILLNLLSNAVKFTEQGTIGLKVILPTAQTPLRLQITDTGIGIQAEDQERIFEAFVQVDSSHTRRYEGTGLGLALSAKLIALLNGQLKLTSALGQGSCFEIELPAQLVVNRP